MDDAEKHKYLIDSYQQIDIVEEIAKFSKLYSAKPLQYLHIFPYTTHPLCCAFSRFDHSFVGGIPDVSMSMFCLIGPNCHRLTYRYLSPAENPGDISFCVNVEEWGRDVFTGDKELVNFLVNNLTSASAYFAKELMLGRVVILEKEGLLFPDFPQELVDPDIMPYWKIKVPSHSKSLIQEIGKCEQIEILSEVQLKTQNQTILTGHFKGDREPIRI